MSEAGRTEAPSPVRLAAAADSAYALPLAVMLRSAAEHLAPDRSLEAHVVDDGLSAEDRRRVEASLPPNGSVQWRASTSAVATLPLWGRMPSTTYQKIAVGDWLPPAAERAIWLDCDVLVRADLSPLWDAAMGDGVVLAAQDALVPHLGSRFGVAGHRALGLPSDKPYFNAGVLVIDLERWRREEIAARAFAYLARFGERVYFWDQEALNAALVGRWGSLEPSWNHNSLVARLRGGPAPPAAIVHYCGRLKPWLFDAVDEHQAEYHRCLDGTAWAGHRPPKSLVHRAATSYARSPLRRLLFEVEQWAVMAHRVAGRLLRRGRASRPSEPAAKVRT